MNSRPRDNSPILVIDDDVGLLTSIEATLVGAGFETPGLLAEGHKALDIIDQGNFRLVLLDLMMPDADGMQLLRKIKFNHPHLECIVFTAVDDVETAMQAVRFGAYGLPRQRAEQ